MNTTPSRTDGDAPPGTAPREIGFLLADAARMLRTATDQRARHLGTTRAQWAVLARLERHQGLSQSDLAAILDIQPITLGRLVDKLCADGMVERRPDPGDRRVNRLHLTPAAYPLLEVLHGHGAGLMAAALAGLADAEIQALARVLIQIKSNLKTELRCGTEPSAATTRPA